ncbi:hypothetical protein [Plesiomonas shigelloides]|uniref:hypothetical protein n=1 Tax=Plesiomonas shigelloides TaxID=703 RepID=UPI001261E300|nr:hypothetical protein [Plesiomonas shigelloides]KAB7693140.1 hypothetical protein GBN28_01365 [Plesiomonas shigelloides]
MNEQIQSLKNAIQELTKTQGRLPKSLIIEELFGCITEAMQSKITLELLVSAMQQQGLDITVPYLRNTLYRIRKKKKEKEIKVKNTPSHSTESKVTPTTPITPTKKISNKEQTEFDDLTRKIESFNAATGWVDRYVALGGDINDIKDQSESQKRQMTMQLKSSISRKMQLYKY